MTVAELKAILNELPDSMDVVLARLNTYVIGEPDRYGYFASSAYVAKKLPSSTEEPRMVAIGAVGAGVEHPEILIISPSSRGPETL